ncbi:Mago binding protein [Ceratocystis platani]|uniref:Mago binding protein n=1 Tax=Ceratocystis fimbriata f. sp. platani TaxID=88771 RepID=A0A0F8BS19_CERFI|nr:Mago binding protein [Ceratocystis platani]
MSPTQPPTTPTIAGIVVDDGGNRVIPESIRPDGTTRKAIRIRPGFRPAEDIERFRPRAAQGRAHQHARGPPGAEYTDRPTPPSRIASEINNTPPRTTSSSAASARASPSVRTPISSTPSTPTRSYSNQSAIPKSPAYLKMSWRRDDSSQKTATPSESLENVALPVPVEKESKSIEDENVPSTEPEAPTIEVEVDREKKARGLKKKLKQARDLQEKESDGKTLLPEQLAKIGKIDELVLELKALGLSCDDDKGGVVTKEGKDV